MLVKILDAKRADYRPTIWQEYRLLCAGGHEMEKAAAHFQPKRPAETADWYQLRLAQFHYKNLVGAIVDDLASTVLQAELEMSPRKEEGQKERPKVDAFYGDDLWPDPTGTGECTINDLAHLALTEAMVSSEAWLFVGFQEGIPGYEFTSRAEQEAAGALRAVIRLIEPEAVVNCGRDRHGLASVMIRNRIRPAELLVDNSQAKEKILWTYLTRTHIAVYQLEVEPGQEPSPEDDAPLVGEPEEHRLANYRDRGAVPMVRLHLPKLWVMDRVASLGKEEMRKRNGLSWYELLACYPQPYHKGDSHLTEKADTGEEKKRGAQYWLEIEKEDELGYLEPSGASLAHLKDRLDQLETDVYKCLQQMAAAQGPGAAKQMESAASKVRDSVAKRILCDRLARGARDAIVQVAEMVSAAREESIAWEAGGADKFDLPDHDGTTNTALMVQGLSALSHSETFQRGFWAKVARDLRPDADTAELDAITAEFEKMEVVKPGEGEDGGPPGSEGQGEDEGDD